MSTAVASNVTTLTVTAPTNEALALLAQHGDREAITALWEQTYPATLPDLTDTNPSVITEWEGAMHNASKNKT